MIKFPKVTEHMDVVVHTLSPETDILEAVNFLLDRGVTGAPVVDHDMKLVGIITAKDCLRLLTRGANHEGIPTGTVADFMTTEVVSIGPQNRHLLRCRNIFGAWKLLSTASCGGSRQIGGCDHAV